MCGAPAAAPLLLESSLRFVTIMGNLTHLCVLSLVILGLGGAAGDSDGQPTAEEVARARPNMQNLDAEADENMAALAANHTLVTKVYVVPTQSGGASGAAARRARLTSQLEAMGVLNITEWVDDANAITRHKDPEVSAAAGHSNENDSFD